MLCGWLHYTGGAGEEGNAESVQKGLTGRRRGRGGAAEEVSVYIASRYTV